MRMLCWNWPDGVAIAVPPVSVGMTHEESDTLGSQPNCPRDSARHEFTNRVLRDRAVWLANVEPMGEC